MLRCGQQFWFALLVMALGCDSGPEKTALRGQVSYKGKAIERGTIDFIPVDGTGGPSATSSITNGQYEVVPERGARVEGIYTVRIIGLKKSGRMFRGHETEDNFIPETYNSRSTLKVKIADLPDKTKADFQLR